MLHRSKAMFRILGCLPWAALLAAIATPAFAQLLTSSDLSRMRSIGGVALSPDNHYIAYTITMRDRPGRPYGQLWVLDLSTEKSIRLGGDKPASGPLWSGDSKWMAFRGNDGDKHNLLIAHPDGSGATSLAELASTNSPLPDMGKEVAWSPDGKQIAFIRTVDSSNPGEPPRAIHVLDLSTNQLTVLPESLGIRLPAWSPDGRHIAAVTIGGRKVMLFDLSTRKWTELADGALIFGPARWSPDGGSIYFQDVLAADEPVYRFRFDNRKKEVLASFEDLLHAGAQRVVFRGFSPDGSLILDVDHSIADVYALDLDLP